MKKESKYVGSSLDEFLEVDGILDAARRCAMEEAAALQNQQVRLL
jgi:hypothetical protein